MLTIFDPKKVCIDISEQEKHAVISSNSLMPILILLRNSTSDTVKLPGNHTSKLPVDVIHYLLHFYCELREEYYFNRAVRVTRGISHIPLLGLLLDSIDLMTGFRRCGFSSHVGSKRYELDSRSTRRTTVISNNTAIKFDARHVLSPDEAEYYADTFNYFGLAYQRAKKAERFQLQGLRELLNKVTYVGVTPEAPSLRVMSRCMIGLVLGLTITGYIFLCLLKAFDGIMTAPTLNLPKFKI